jgi:type VI secretion system protein ImpH
MATATRNATDPVAVLQRLRAEPHRYSLFAALRLVERAYAGHPRLGESRRAATEAVRLAQPPYLSFAPSDVTAVTTNDQGRMVVEAYSFGVFGPNGALPLHLTEMAFERRRQLDDPTLSDFVNLFQHRMMALFYRAWADADPATNYDRATTDRFKLYVGALVGLGTNASRDRDAVPDHAKLSRAAQFGAQSRSPQGLESALSDYFNLPIQVRSFVGDWLDIPSSTRTRLGSHSESAALGIGTTLGASSWQCQHKFEIAAGPLDLTAFNNFLPGSPGLRELVALVRLYTNDEWSWQLRLLLRAEEIPPLRLGGGARLGWSTWMGARAECAHDVAIQGDYYDSTLT